MKHKKYKLNNHPSFSITNEGKSTEIKIVTDNTGRTKIVFGNSYQLMIDTSDLESIVENFSSALDVHRDQAFNDNFDSKQIGLPFGDDHDVELIANDPRNW